jgi:hypothetical protein
VLLYLFMPGDRGTIFLFRLSFIPDERRKGSMKWTSWLLMLIFLGILFQAVAGEQQKEPAARSTLMIPWDAFSIGGVIGAQSGKYTSTAFVTFLPAEIIDNDKLTLHSGFLNPEFIDILTSVKEWRELGMPTVYRLQQNYPNPFNPATSIRYSLPEKCQLRLDVYDLLGQWVTTLSDGQQEAGYHISMWDGRDAVGQPVSTGVYFYRLIARSAKGQTFIQSKKMLLVK